MEIDESFLLENFPQCNPSDLSFVDFEDTTDLADLNFDGILDDLDIDLYLNDPSLDPIDSKPNSPNSSATNSSKTESPKSNNSNNNKRKIDDADNHRPSNSNPNVDEKRKARQVRNRESAQLSRQRKKQHVEELEQKVKNLTFTVSDLNGKLSYYMAENVRLRNLVNGNAGNGSNHVNVHPTPPLPPMPYHYPWMPYVPYPMKPNSVPIPRLNKEESKRSGRKRKKLASVSAMGLFLLAMLVIGGVTNYGLSENKEIDGGGGKVFETEGHDPDLTNSSNSSNSSKNKTVESANMGKMYSEVMSELGDKSSEGLPALLYVPRNGKHVEINGNLIIQSVLASERAATNESLGLNEKSLAIANPMGLSLALSNSRGPRGSGNINDKMKTLPSGPTGVYRDDIKSTLADKYLQQWFLEGLAGPGLSSATCTEVFQLDVSPSSSISASTMIPASSVLNNVTNKLPPSSYVKSRRMGQPIPLSGKTLNNKTQLLEEPLAASNSAFRGKTSSSSIVVSVLYDPREVSDVDCDGIVGSKSLSRIFVVLLVDSVKYITYSCMLPLKSPVTRVVN